MADFSVASRPSIFAISIETRWAADTKAISRCTYLCVTPCAEWPSLPANTVEDADDPDEVPVAPVGWKDEDRSRVSGLAHELEGALSEGWRTRVGWTARLERANVPSMTERTNPPR